MLVVLCIVIYGFAVYAEETVESHDLADGSECIGCTALADGDGGLLDLCIGHLRGESTFPYQFIEAAFGRCTLYCLTVHIGGTYGLVSLLSSFGLGLEVACLVIFGSHILRDDLLAGTETKARQVSRVGTHVGDLSRFVESLGNGHRL